VVVIYSIEEGQLDAGKAFLAANASKEGVQTTASGLQYKVITQGDGVRPSADSEVEVHYEGRLIDGKIFDSSYQRGESISFFLSQVITGWQEGVQLMPVGSKYELYIPHELGYGARGAPGVIPPFSTLIFVVELLKVY
jgi:FKBP-type peptidyl-prolyl cis-trans isomerase